MVLGPIVMSVECSECRLDSSVVRTDANSRLQLQMGGIVEGGDGTGPDQTRPTTD